MADMLEITVDKFIFRIPTDLYYSPEGVWVKVEGDKARLGISDFLQQNSGDVAFAEVTPAGSEIAADDELAVVETIKVDTSLPSPVSGKIVAVNETLELEGELINQDPYGEGWLALVAVTDWEQEKANLLDARAYADLVQAQAEEELKKL